eukprot:349801-Chlamydomonas_euryale.AAC.70
MEACAMRATNAWALYVRVMGLGFKGLGWERVLCKRELPAGAEGEKAAPKCRSVHVAPHILASACHACSPCMHAHGVLLRVVDPPPPASTGGHVLRDWLATSPSASLSCTPWDSRLASGSIQALGYTPAERPAAGCGALPAG